MNNVSFQSRIRPVTRNEFGRITSGFGKKNFVDFPWTLKESVLSDKAYTRDVADCTVCGITDGLKVLLIHLSPVNKANQEFDKVVNFIKSKLDLANPDLQAILIGGKPSCTHGSESYCLFEKFEKFLSDSKIVFSKLKGGMGTKDVAYSSTTDEWLIASDNMKPLNPMVYTSPEAVLKQNFSEVVISSEDNASWF